MSFVNFDREMNRGIFLGNSISKISLLNNNSLKCFEYEIQESLEIHDSFYSQKKNLSVSIENKM
jgi:hypothetical protein